MSGRVCLPAVKKTIPEPGPSTSCSGLMALGRNRNKLVDCLLSVYCLLYAYGCVCACDNWYVSDLSVRELITGTTGKEEIWMTSRNIAV